MYAFLFTMLSMAAQADPAGSYLFDLGSHKSAVWEGCTRVTPESVFSPQTRFGWQSKDGLRALVRAYTGPVENRSRGRDEPPPIWTNAITEDAILGDRENVFLFTTPPGDYEVYVLCGTSEAMSSQYFDFTVQVGDDQRRVQIEGGYQFRALRFHARAGNEPLAVKFTPRSKWVSCAILAWTAADDARVQQQIVKPLEEWTYRMPPAEWAQWKEDPEPDSGPLPPLSEADRKRGFVVYSRHYLECVYPHTKPRPEDVNPTLRLFATQGEYEPLNFVVYPLADLRDARVSVSGIGPVPASNIDVRHVRFLRARPNYTVRYRYRVVPDVLEHFQTLDMPAGENARFWITVHVPDDAPAGTYRGNVSLQCSSGKADVPVTLRILPFRLQDDPGKLFGIYYRHPYDQMARADDEVSREHFRRRAGLEYADMVAHGTRNVVLSCGSSAADAQGNFQFRFELLADEIALGQEYGFRGPIVVHISTEAVYAKYVKARYGSHLRGVQDPPEEFSRELTALVKAIEAERRKRGWPEFLYYPVDEPSTDQAAVNNRHEPDGTPIPVALWEAYREGYDDYRYVYTLEQKIAEAKKRPHTACQQAADTAERELQSVWNAIRVQTKYKYDGLWSPAEFDVYRWLVAQQILTLQDVLAKNR